MIDIRSKIVSEARSWIKTPYHHRGNKKGVAADCGMLLINVFSDAGVIERYNPDHYPMDWMMHRCEEKYLENVEQYAKKIKSDPMPGDIALFKFGRCISHGGIITEWPMIVHAYKPSGIVLEDNVSIMPALSERLVGFWSVFGE